MISLSKRLSKEYNNIEEFSYQEIPANTLFPIRDRSPINFEVRPPFRLLALTVYFRSLAFPECLSIRRKFTFPSS